MPATSSTRTDPPAFRRHQFGGYLGGRIIKDKTFYFANYEQLTEVKGLSANDPTLSADAQKGLLCQQPLYVQDTGGD